MGDFFWWELEMVGNSWDGFGSILVWCFIWRVFYGLMLYVYVVLGYKVVSGILIWYIVLFFVNVIVVIIVVLLD